MAEHRTDEFAQTDWETVGLRLLVFTRYWARAHYRWRPGESLPAGKSPEDMVCEVYAAFATGQRVLKAGIPVLVQLKGAVRSMLWNLYVSKDAALTHSVAPGDLESQLASDDVAADVAGSDFCAEFWRQLYLDPQVQRSRDLERFARAVEGGAETVEQIGAVTGLSIAQIYEFRRRLKAVAEKIFTSLNQEGQSHEHRIQESDRAPASGLG